MKIFVLVIVCFYTLLGFCAFTDEDSRDSSALLGLVMFVSGIIAICFQSNNL